MVQLNLDSSPVPPKEGKETKEKFSAKQKISKAFARLASEMWKSSSPTGSNHGVQDPSGFRREIGTFAPKFLGFDQHDSQEFLQYTLDGIHTELNRVSKTQQVEKRPL